MAGGRLSASLQHLAQNSQSLGTTILPALQVADLIHVDEKKQRWLRLPSCLGETAEIQCVVFVVDSHDLDRIIERPRLLAHAIEA